MSLFINPVLDAYRNDPRIQRALGSGISLLNIAEFSAWIAPANRKSDRVASIAAAAGHEEEERLLLRRQASLAEKVTITRDILEKLALNVCVDPKTGKQAIGTSYGISAVRRLANANFDILVAIENSTIPAGYTATVAQNKLDRVVGFIIAELGECKRKPDVWSVNLICTRTIKSGSTIKGIILLGAFVYCIKNSRYTKEGILELAGGYNNINGFISYTKMGFNKNLSLFGRDCFSDFNNLPMSVDIARINNETILNRAGEIERRRVTPTEDDSGLYSAGRIDPAVQHMLIVCNDLLYRIQIAFNDIQRDPYSLGSRELYDMFRKISTIVGLDRNKMIQDLENDRTEILKSIGQGSQGAAQGAPADDDYSCIKQCFKGICKCIGWNGGKKTRKLHKKRLTKKSYRKHNKKTRTHHYRK